MAEERFMRFQLEWSHAWQFARCSQLPAVKKRKYWRSRNTAH
jgi:hypothetical protein